MRQSLMAAVIELNEEIDNVHAPICEQAQVSNLTLTLTLFAVICSVIIMSFPSVENAKLTVRHGTNVTVSPTDVDNADTIWGPDTATLKGKSTEDDFLFRRFTFQSGSVRSPDSLSIVDIYGAHCDICSMTYCELGIFY